MKSASGFFIAFSVVVADQATKYIARTSISTFETVKVLPFLQLVSVRNEGAAFGLFKGLGNTMFIVVSVLAILIVSYLLTRKAEERLAFSLILGGATGNLIDRIVFGKVTDFVDVFVGRFHWPAFNVADSALTIGLVIILLNSFLSASKREPA